MVSERKKGLPSLKIDTATEGVSEIDNSIDKQVMNVCTSVNDTTTFKNEQNDIP
jgi:hypothetical protein